MRRLVVAPHMDDESLGCGGLLAKFPEDSIVVTVAGGDAARQDEHALALKTLGLEESIGLDLPDGAVGGEMASLVGRLDDLLARLRPDEVYLPFPSLHQDHIATYEAGMRACRISMSPGHWVPRTVLVYDVAVYDLSLYPTDLRWNVFESLTEEEADLKAQACAAYVTQSPGGPHPMASVKEHAATVGHMRRVAYAEQYALVRQIRD